MARYNYATKGISEEHAAKAVGQSLPISRKTSVEVCAFIRNKSLDRAKSLLQLVINKKIAVPFKKFNKDVGHRKGKIAAGRYPKKTCEEILKLLESVEANAQFKGLNTANLVISSIIANAASRPWHYGRQRRRKMKRTNVEIVVEERAEKKEEKVKKKETKKEAKPEATQAASDTQTKSDSSPKVEEKAGKLSNESEKGLEKSKTFQKEKKEELKSKKETKEEIKK
ncbi:50S ribosomal protein L22 [Candidatus Woesearchaeota archaeon]|nr:50S ribosomal protein L22 [Candidatus Woesearchaeota archaeon]